MGHFDGNYPPLWKTGKLEKLEKLITTGWSKKGGAGPPLIAALEFPSFLSFFSLFNIFSLPDFRVWVCF
jgi:hypothetical protein